MDNPNQFPLISIVMPVLNREDFLEVSLQSIVSQTYRPIELILVDNGSEDRSLSICQDFQTANDHDFFRTVLLHEKKRGANYARNAGLAKASGDFLMFFDSDDLMYPDCVSRIVIQLVLNHFPKAIAYPFLIAFPNGKKVRRPHYFSADPADQLFDIIIHTHNVCLRRTLPEKTGPWSESLQRWQDLEFGFRLLQGSSDIFWMTGKPLYQVNFHQASISGNTYSDDHQTLYDTLMVIRSSIEKQPDSLEKYRQQRALCYKIVTLASQIRKDGNKPLGKKYLNLAILQLPHRFRKRAILFFRFQYIYEGCHGRGLWRIARILL